MHKLNLAVAAIIALIIASIWIPSMVLKKADAATDFKIGVVNLDQAAMEYEYWTEELETYRGQFEERRDEIDVEFRILVERREGLRGQAASMSLDDRFDLKLKIQDDFFSLEQRLNRLDADQLHAQERLELRISHDIRSVLETIASEENYHLVLDARDGTSNGVIYASTTINMTQKLIDRLNEARPPQN